LGRSLIMSPTNLSTRLSKGAELRSHSKKLKAGDLFYVMGAGFDPEQYLPEILAKKPAGLVVPSNFRYALGDFPTLRVQDVRATFLEDCQCFYADLFQDLSLLGVTGTKGKTTIAYLLYWFLENLGVHSAYSGTLGIVSKDFSLKTLNTTPGLADFIEILQSLKSRGVTHMVAEVSSQGLAQYRVPIERFKTRIFTGLSREHLECHGTMEEYFLAKARFFQEKESPFSAILLDRCPYSSKILENLSEGVLRYGIKNNSLFSISEPRYTLGAIEINLNFEGCSHPIKIPWTGFYNLENFLAVLEALLVEGFKIEEVLNLCPRLPQVPGRMEELSQHNGARIFVDYAHTTEALNFLLQAMRPLTMGRLVVLFGCGGERDPAKRPGMAKAAARYADQVFLTQDNSRNESPNGIVSEILPGFGAFKDYRVILDRREAIAEGVKVLGPGDIFLVCGKGHEESQIIGESVVRFSDREEIQKACSLHHVAIGVA
jgi:UDP-N-acetylmuramoyl-L-alanyl-D-glutamate--2,6-diaminopimelate ligase